jgi:hypothetical protein
MMMKSKKKSQTKKIQLKKLGPNLKDKKIIGDEIKSYL